MLTVSKEQQSGFRFIRKSITLTYDTGVTTSNIAVDGEGTGDITYSIDNLSVATIDTNSGEVTIEGAGIAIITAEKAADDRYESVTTSYVLTVNKAEQTDFRFTQNAVTIRYVKEGIVNNPTKGGKGTGATTYSIDNTSVATVDDNGQLTIKGVGTAKITATKAEDANYNAITISYVLTVNRAQQTDFRFARGSITTVYEADKKISSTATGGVGTGVISYGIDNLSVASIDTNSGEVTIKGAGTAIITATKAADDRYESVTTSYVLTVNKAQQTGFSFAQDAISTEYGTDKKVSNGVTGGQGTGAVTYSIDNISVASIDANSGEVTIKGIGTAKITATKAADANYDAVTSSYVLTVNKAQQSGFSFAQNAITTKYGKDKKVSNRITGGQGKGAVTYSIDNTSVASIDSNSGEVTIKSIGTAIITATKAGDTNYEAATTSYTLTVNSKEEQTGFGFAQKSITLSYAAGATKSNVASGGQSKGAVTYSIDNTSVATINTTNSKVTIKGIGKAIITATKAGDSEYNAITSSYVLTVNKLDQNGFGFTKNSITLIYNAGATTSNSATGGQTTGAVTYSIDNTSVATIDANSGEVTIKSPGTARITATKAGDAIYNAVISHYVLTVNDKKNQINFRFIGTHKNTYTHRYTPNRERNVITRGGSGTGAVTYSISDTSVATIETIDDNTGRFTMKGVGTAIVTATKAGDAEYKPVTISVTLRINENTELKTAQTGFSFARNAITMTLCGGCNNKQYCHRWTKRRGGNLQH